MSLLANSGVSQIAPHVANVGFAPRSAVTVPLQVESSACKVR
jgi:hypothetical protein